MRLTMRLQATSRKRGVKIEAFRQVESPRCPSLAGEAGR